MRKTALAALLLLPGLASAQFFGLGVGVPVGHHGFVSFGYRGGYYGYPGYYYPPPVTYVYPAPTVVVSQPATVVPPAPAVVSGQTARITVLLADPNAELLIQGQRMNSVGSTRVFNSQALEPGKNYSYTLTARSHVAGRLVDDTRKVPVHAGEQLTVDFTQPATGPVGGERLPPADVLPR